jgi:hypothetical protein
MATLPCVTAAFRGPFSLSSLDPESQRSIFVFLALDAVAVFVQMPQSNLAARYAFMRSTPPTTADLHPYHVPMPIYVVVSQLQLLG